MNSLPTKYLIKSYVIDSPQCFVLQKKCEQYWPSAGSQTYGEVTVESLDTVEYTDYIIRTFTLSVVSTSHITSAVILWTVVQL